MLIRFDPYCIRDFSPADAEAMVRYADNIKIWQRVRDRFPHPYTLKDAIDWIQFSRHSKAPCHFAISTKAELIGSIGYERQSDVNRISAEIGYWLGEPFWGIGIMSRAVSEFVDHIFVHTDLMRLYACVFENNPASARVLSKAGFTCEARMRDSVYKNDRVMDQFLYALIRSDWEEKSKPAQGVYGS